MSTPILATKLYIPSPRPKIVLRSRLSERLNEGLALGRKLTLISASAGFGKTTLVSEWIARCEQPVAWLSLDEGDNDPTRFLTYLVAALQTIRANLGEGVVSELQSLQPPPSEAILTAVLNEITTIPDHFILVLDDYHLIDSKPVDHALTFLIEHLPPQMHLVIATREDPSLPLARLRARGQLTELRAADLRFTPAEAVDFLNEVMGLDLPAEAIAALETRTEGWIAGLQLAAISMQGLPNVGTFIQSFTGSHHFVLDYLVEEVLGQQAESVQTFLLRTSILERLCGPLCDAVCAVGTARGEPFASGQETLEYLEHANLFIVPLDNERRWYRYHHLFADLLRQRLPQSIAAFAGDEGGGVAELHSRASQWYEDHGFEIEAFQHAAAANDVERAERLIDEKGLHLHFRGVAAIRNWLESLPTTVLDARPSLWVRYASALLVAGQTTDVEEKLQAAERALASALQSGEPDIKTRELIGKIAAARATVALTQYQVEALLDLSRRAREHLPPEDLLSLSRSRVNRTMAMAELFRGERAAGGQADAEDLPIARTSGNIIYTILATTCRGQTQEVENRLYAAAETYRHVLQLIGDYSPPNAAEVYLGLARIHYEWNDLDAAAKYGQQSLQLARQYEQVIDSCVVTMMFLGRLKLAQGDAAGAATMVEQAKQSAIQYNFVHRTLEIAGVQMLVLLRQGDLTAAARLSETHPLPISRARVLIALGDTSAALAALESLRRELEAKNWQDELLKVVVLQAVALYVHGEKEQALQALGEAFELAEPGGFVRLFVDEGTRMAELVSAASVKGIRPDYVEKLLAAFPMETKVERPTSSVPGPCALVEPLSARELDVLHLIAQGLSNQEIGERLFLALDTVKGHNRRIFEKLQVQRRTEAIARARELRLL